MVKLGKETQGKANKWEEIQFDYQKLKKAHFWVKQKIADENVK